MIYLHSKRNLAVGKITLDSPLIAAITENSALHPTLRPNFALRWRGNVDIIPEGFALTLLSSDIEILDSPNIQTNSVRLAPELDYLSTQDIVKFSPHDMGISVLFRERASSNAFLLTERCNSFCLMCSQPPRNIDDSYIVEDILKTLPLIPKNTVDIGFTGGEPTILGPKFLKLIRAAKAHLPNTGLHILSNGRNFKDLQLAIEVSKINHPDLMFGIPLYADYSQLHDYIVQADDAFDDTIRGVLNLKRCLQKVELRVVIHRLNYYRLPQLARFIARNLLFVDHVALMGLELMGFAKSNLDSLWIDPFDYRDELAEAINILDSNRIKVSIYNHPLCVINEDVRQFSVSSISDWKNEYFDECKGCGVRNECGGFFSSHALRRSKFIRPL